VEDSLSSVDTDRLGPLCRQTNHHSEHGSYVWLPSRDHMSFAARQIGPSVSYWLQRQRAGHGRVTDGAA
jgi:hypothetical protein